MENVKEEIKARLPVEEVIGRYLELKRAGRNLKALSPFTNEKTPSFMVSPERNVWHDYSSGKGGDIFSFVMEPSDNSSAYDTSNSSRYSLPCSAIYSFRPARLSPSSNRPSDGGAETPPHDALLKSPACVVRHRRRASSKIFVVSMREVYHVYYA